MLDCTAPAWLQSGPGLLFTLLPIPEPLVSPCQAAGSTRFVLFVIRPASDTEAIVLPSFANRFIGAHRSQYNFCSSLSGPTSSPLPEDRPLAVTRKCF